MINYCVTIYLGVAVWNGVLGDFMPNAKVRKEFEIPGLPFTCLQMRPQRYYPIVSAPHVL